MTARDACTIVIRLYMLTVLLRCVPQVVQVAAVAFGASAAYQETGWSLLAVSFLNLLLLVPFWFLMTKGAGSIAGLICGKHADVVITPLASVDDLTVLGVGLMSLLFTISGFTSTSEILTRWWYGRRESRTLGLDGPNIDQVQLMLSVMILALGVSLFFGARGFVRLFRWAREAGPTRGGSPAGDDEA